MPPPPPAGWFRDGDGERWWNGEQWTDRRRSLVGGQWVEHQGGGPLTPPSQLSIVDSVARGTRRVTIAQRAAALTVLLAALAAGYALFASDDELSVASSGAVAPGDVVASFRAANLEVGETTPMGPKDYGHGPAVATEGIRFLIPSLGRDNGGRAMSFSSVEDLWSLKEYYDGVGRATAALFSWTFANEQSLVLVQINGDLPASQAHRYRRIIADL